MYETLIMLKPEASFSLDDLEQLVRKLVSKSVERKASAVILSLDSSYLQIDYSNASHVIEESREMAERYSLNCQDCAERFEMHADDMDMDFFNDYLVINEHLEKTNKFIIFDPNQGKLFGS